MNRVDEWVNGLKGKPIRSFYPSGVAKQTGLPVTAVYQRLCELAETGTAIRLEHELLCPECHAELDRAEHADGLLDRDVECHMCGCGDEEMAVTKDMLQVSFRVNTE